MFDVGALIFKIQAVGQQVFGRDMAQADQSIKKVEGSSKSAKTALEGQGKATDDVGGKSDAASKKQRKQAEATEAQVQAAKSLSVALVASGLAITAVVGLSVAKFTEFDAQMSNVRAATMATAQEQRDLADAALDAGADTAYSATEAAAAQEELAKAGQSVADITGGSLVGALSLAAAGQLAVARSAEIMATTLKQYNLEADQAGHVSDILAAGAGKAQGSVDDLALALQYVGPVAAGLNISLEETGGVLAYLASQGILGERAGTGLRGVLMSLTAPSQIATKTMQQYGIEIFDANGNMKSLATVSEILRQRLGGLTEAERSAALGRIFGNEQITTARILYAGGAEAIEKWTAEVNDSGYAAEQAAIRQDNLAGDVEKLGGAFDTALIKTGSGANDVLREMVQSVTALVDWYGELPQEVQTTALVFGVLTGAVVLASGAAVGLRVRFIELKEQFDKSNISMGKTALIGGAVGLALTGVITIVALLAQKHAEARQRAEAYADALGQGAKEARKFVADQLTAEESWLWVSRGSAADAAEKFGISLDTLADAAQGNKDALAELSDVMKAGAGDQAAAQRLADEHGLSLLEVSSASTRALEGIDALRKAEEDGKRITEQKNEITEEGVGVTESATDAYIEATDGIKDLNSQLSELIDRINEANGVGQDAITANLDYRDALAKVDEVIANGERTLNGNTQAGRDNLAMLVALAEDAQKAAEAQFDLDRNTDNYRATLEASRQELIDRATQLGMNADEAQALADQIFRIPSETEWKMIAETTEAQTKVDAWIARNAGRRFNVYIDAIGGAGSGGRGALFQADGGKVQFFADGGRNEHHIAQFARAGDYRVWAEPETGGEWYLPNSPSKRARSLAIAEQMLEEWGYGMVPLGGPASSGGWPDADRGARVVNITQHNTFQQTDERLQVRAMGSELKRVLSSE